MPGRRTRRRRTAEIDQAENQALGICPHLPLPPWTIYEDLQIRRADVLSYLEFLTHDLAQGGPRARYLFLPIIPQKDRTPRRTALQKITDSGTTKIILASHSRHIFDALTYNDYAKVVWLKAGVKQPESDRSSLSILLDLGALDSFELVQPNKKHFVILTEDTKTGRLQVLLEANGLQKDDYLMQPLNGVTNLTAAIPVADFFIKQCDNTHVVVHHDGDCMTDAEKTQWIETESKKFPERTHLFVTPFSDIEHSFASRLTSPRSTAYPWPRRPITKHSRKRWPPRGVTVVLTPVASKEDLP